MDKILDTDVLPCGCVLRRVISEEGRKELQLSPCKVDCMNYINALDLASERRVPVEYRTIS